jgi:hypothetical protein
VVVVTGSKDERDRCSSRRVLDDDPVAVARCTMRRADARRALDGGTRPEERRGPLTVPLTTYYHPHRALPEALLRARTSVAGRRLLRLAAAGRGFFGDFCGHIFEE